MLAVIWFAARTPVGQRAKRALGKALGGGKQGKKGKGKPKKILEADDQQES
ncbi:hypothetical protein [Streptomyces sp. NPDC002889]|uniref:hypothetical protein n=1 Tax=Streptomyces sp. NPDC002889 TaxID=3364669 RepID=UPI00369306CC